MVIPSLIHRALNEEGPLSVWGDGSAVRDFIHAKDVADGMMICLAKGITEPVNLGSGGGVSIKDVAETVAKLTKKKVEWDTSKPSGDRLRIMDTNRALSLGIQPKISLEEGILQTLSWYKENSVLDSARYNSFTEVALLPQNG